MDITDSLVKGGVSIIHQIHEGKHQYEVDSVIKLKKANAGKPFVRKGDRLMQINGVTLQDIIPEELAEMLAQGNPMLTVHQATKIKEQHADQTCPDEDALYPVSKETTLLRFSLEMRREEDLGDDERKPTEQGWEGGDRDDKVCQSENGDVGQKGDLLIIAMMNTSVTVVKGRACDNGSSCLCCSGKGCTINEVVMVAESSVVTLGGGCSSFKQEKKMANISLEHAASNKYIRSFCTQNRPYVSPNPEKITIYSYKAEVTARQAQGTPVALNFSDSNCFLKCCKDGDKVLLKVEVRTFIQKLKKICQNDATGLSFIFYMTSTKTKERKFESALCLGWFIHIVNSDKLEMVTPSGQADDPSFFFIIQK
uniref:Interleukin-1 beta n=1 Tax=Myripristis murdjan TaxID=586833 RepID=A0A667X0L0_9TELE